MTRCAVFAMLATLVLCAAGGAWAEPAATESASSGQGARPFMDVLRRADTNQDGKVSFEELQAVAPDFPKARFDKLDRNGDGFLSPEDRPARPGDSPGASRADRVERLRAADTDADGKVSREEFDKAFPHAPGDLFTRLDTNGDGAISPADRPEATRGRPDRAALRERFRAADKDGDGKVSREEFRAANPGSPAGRFDQIDRNGDGFLTPADMPQHGPRGERQPDREKPRRERRSKPAAE